ncbi:MAG: tryptophan-rich sensory protein [Beijerinckiaceae bacterium]|nr:tryptophan-rich sensory protein [Beijerinckiaceae bacterium]MCZ8301424.1 tryptophan-rich sensory protein [Beijerinckiaceae bacterium]
MINFSGLDTWILLPAAGAAVIVAILGGVATDVGDWYKALRKPFWQPPNWLFGPVWTTIFALAVIAFAMGWRDAPGADARRMLIVVYAVNAVLNIVWSFLFFKFRRPDWALGELVFLWLSILAMILVLWPFSPGAAVLLLPYILWVSTAGFLNWEILRLNGSFRGASR